MQCLAQAEPTTLTALVILGCVLLSLCCLFLLVTILDRALAVWRRKGLPRQPEFLELKDYTRRSVHDLRNGVASHGERIARLEALAETLTQNLARLLSICEELLRHKGASAP